MTDIWFTSDTHLLHTGIMKHEPLMRGGYADALEMTHRVIEVHNAHVKPGDKVIHLGDVAMGPIADSLPMVGLLNGDIELYLGNHDRPHRIMTKGKAAQQERWDAEYGKYFDIKGMQGTLTLPNGADILLCHFPYEGDSHGEDRHSEYRPVDTGLPLVHGHVHSQWRTNGRQMNVGIDANDLRPTHIDEIVQWVNTL